MSAAFLCRGRCAATSLPAIHRARILDVTWLKRVRGPTLCSRAFRPVGCRHLSVGVQTPEEPRQPSSDLKWDITPEKKLDIKWTQADLDRFPAERAAFRDDPRLCPSSVPDKGDTEPMDLVTTLRGAVSSVRVLGDYYTTIFEDLIYDRVAERPDLLDLFQIPVIEDKCVVQESHSKAVPGAGTYFRVRRQAYWLALHMWLIHTKQLVLQEGEGVFVSALCTLLTRRMFEYQWNLIRGLLHAADVPIMSVTSELQDMQEFVFGFCVALDGAFKEEAPAGVAAALALEDSELPEGHFGLAPRVKYALWANVYSGAIEHDAPELYELTVYMLRQRMLLDTLQRDAFLSCRFTWAEHPLRQR